MENNLGRFIFRSTVSISLIFQKARDKHTLIDHLLEKAMWKGLVSLRQVFFHSFSEYCSVPTVNKAFSRAFRDNVRGQGTNSSSTHSVYTNQM